jgi:hypothetical protein
VSASALERPTSGQVRVAGTDLAGLPDRRRVELLDGRIRHDSGRAA